MQMLMRPRVVVVRYKRADSVSQLGRIVCWVDIDVFLLYGAPESFNPDIVLASSTSVHADFNIVFVEQGFPFRRCILASLIGIHDFGDAVLSEAFLHQFQTVVYSQCVAQATPQDIPAVHIDNSV